MGAELAEQAQAKFEVNIHTIRQKRWEYTLSQLNDGSLILSVPCGTVAMYELNLLLDEDSAAKALVDEEFLSIYASDVRSHPHAYAHLSIHIDTRNR